MQVWNLFEELLHINKDIITSCTAETFQADLNHTLITAFLYNIAGDLTGFWFSCWF